MPRRFALLLLICLAPLAVEARPVWDAARAETVLDDPRSDLGAALAAMGLAAGAPVPTPGVATLPVARAGVLETGDLQIALTQLAIHEGTNNQIRVMRAQSGAGDAMILRAGNATLRDLARQAATAGLPGLAVVDGVHVLTRPLVVWQGAGLRIEPGDRLEMQAGSGAFLVSFGPVDIAGAEIAATGFAPGAEAFRPFVLISGQGTLQARDSVFTALGMADLKPFDGLFLSNQGLFPPAYPPILTGNRFVDLGGVSLRGLADVSVTANRFDTARGTALSLIEVRGGVVADNIVEAAAGGASLSLTTVDALLVRGNLLRGGAGNGLTLDGNSGRVELSGNAAIGNAGSGMALLRTQCLRVAGNGSADNGASGLRLSRIGAAQLSGNALVLNAQAGLLLRDQTPENRIEISGNLFARNRTGLSGGPLGSVLLTDNDLTQQLPRLFHGEFAQYQSRFLTAAQQQGDALFRITALADDIPFPALCDME